MEEEDKPADASSSAISLPTTSSIPPLGPTPLHKTAILRSISQESDPPVESIQDISHYQVLYLRKHHREMVLNKHVKAEDVRRMMDDFSSHARRSIFRRRCQTSLHDLRGRLSTTAGEQAIVRAETDERLARFEAAAKARLETMRARQAAEWRRHEADRPDETPAKFRRRSPQLLEMFRQERRLFFQSRFCEAAEMRQKCEEQDGREEAECRRRATEHWEAAGGRMRERHRQEEEAITQWIEMRRTEIARDGRCRDEAIARRTTLLGAEIDATSGTLRKSAPHAVMRTLLFDRTPSRGTLFAVSESEDLDKCYESLPTRAKEILLDLK
jgi:hypothetical protein